MRILVVTQYFWPENFRINDLVLGLNERGHDVTILTGIPNYPEGSFYKGYGYFKKVRQQYHGAEIIRVPLIPRGKGVNITLLINYVSFAFFACILSPFLVRGKYDLIFVCQLSPVTVGLPAVLLKKFKKIPIIFWVLDLWPESLSASGSIRSPKILAIMESVVRFIYQNSDKIVVSSKGFIPSIVSKGISEKKIDYFPNWYEPEYIVRNINQHLSQTHKKHLPDGFKVMFAGNIGSSQDFETILSAAEILKKKYHDIHWIILGHGRRFEWVKNQIKIRELSESIHMLGSYPSESMVEFFNQADVMLVILKKEKIFSMTIPGKIQSYMACSKPIIAAVDGECNRLVIESGAGIASPSEDPEELAKSVLTLYFMPKEKRDAMGKSGKDYCIYNFNREKLIDRLEKWMQELV